MVDKNTLSKILGLDIEQIAWMKYYFQKNLIEIGRMPFEKAKLKSTWKGDGHDGKA